MFKALTDLRFSTLWLFIGVVSAYDAYLVSRYCETILEFELNPVGRYLIELNDGNVGVFLRAKAAGTLIVMSSLAIIHVRSERLAYPIVGSLAVLQFLLLLFLTLY